MDNDQAVIIRDLIFLNEMQQVLHFVNMKIKEAENTERPFVITLCGAFSTGKSSLINALLGQQIKLPTGINPVTKVITRIRYGVKKRVILENHATHQSWEISFEDAAKLITEELNDLPKEDVSIYVEMPSSLLAKNVQLVDTPGFEDDINCKLDELTRKEIKNSDFCIVTFNSTHFGAQKERDFLKELHQLTNGSFVSVLNCINYIRRDMLNDLEHRADELLKDYGNTYIGKGVRFSICSKPGEEELDNFDVWLDDLIDEKSRRIKASVPYAIAVNELNKALKSCNVKNRTIIEHIAKLQQENQKEIRRKKVAFKISAEDIWKKILQDRTEIMIELENNCIENIYKSFSSLDHNEFSTQAKKILETDLLHFFKVKEAYIKRKYPKLRIQESLMVRITKAIDSYEVPEPTFKTIQYGFFERLLYGDSYRVYNNYIASAKSDIQSELLPKLNRRISSYFDELHKALNENIQQITDVHEDEISEWKEYEDKLADIVIQMSAVRQNIRNKLFD